MSLFFTVTSGWMFDVIVRGSDMEDVVLLKPAVKVTEFSNKRQLEQLICLYVHIF